jgi:predicted small secreted protein
MYTADVVKHKSFWLIISLVVVLVLVLTACGTNSGTKAGSAGTGTTPTPAPKVVKGYGASYGCPSDVVDVTPATPNVLVKPGSSASTVTAHVGDVIEFDLASGQMWNGPTGSQGILQLQTPYGYVWKTGNTSVCVWQLVAKGTGETQVKFTARALCKKGTLCPHYALDLSFTVEVK